MLRNELPDAPVLIFDEIHKYRGWRNWLKGIWDGRRGGTKVLVTGSARLDLYRRGGDSLQGRYHFLRLHPVSLAEAVAGRAGDLNDLLNRGGFPEPLLGGDAIEAKRWSREYRTRLIRDDLASLEQVQDLGKIELLVLRLPDLVGSPLSLNALSEDLGVAHKTIQRWIEALERLYAVFRVPPFGGPSLRAVRKARKHYHADWSLVKDQSARFENLVASHLLKWVHFEEDSKGRDLDLRYFRDVDGREVDFVVTEEQKPILLVETKWSDAPADKAIRDLKRRFPGADAWQISATGSKEAMTPEGVRLAPAAKLLRTLI
jgi:hypothetical protein